MRTAFDFVWREGRDPSEPAEFAALRERLPDAEGRGLDEAKAGLREATDAAIAAGVFGVPTLRIGAELFWGVDAIPMAEAYLEDRALLGRGEMARLRRSPLRRRAAAALTLTRPPPCAGGSARIA